MGLFSRKPDPPANQYGNVTQPPVDPTDKGAKQKRLEADRVTMSTAESSEADGDIGTAQFFRRLLGD